MGPRRTFVVALVAVSIALPFAVATRGLADVDVRTRANHARQAMRLDASAPTAQGFRSDVDGLSRIDVPLSGSDGKTAKGRVVMTLRDDEGREVARSTVVVRGLAAPFELVPFRFEPVAQSAGRHFTFELRPELDGASIPVTPWMRARRLPGVRVDRGPIAHHGPVVEGELESHWSQLSAVAVECATVLPGEARFELFAEGSDTPLRTSVLGVDRAQGGGSLLFAFEPLEASRWAGYRFRVHVPPGSLLLGGALMPATTQYHGPLRRDERLFGAMSTGWPDGSSDLVFRTFGESRPLALLFERAGAARIAVALAAWAWAVALLFVAVGRCSASRPDAGS